MKTLEIEDNGFVLYTLKFNGDSTSRFKLGISNDVEDFLFTKDEAKLVYRFLRENLYPTLVNE